jgi:hypothetical protein
MSKINSNKIVTILRKKFEQNELTKADFVDLFNLSGPDKSVLLEDLNFVKLIYEFQHIIYDDSGVYEEVNKFIDENEHLLKSKIVPIIINKLESENMEEIFKVWDYKYLFKLSKKEIIALFEEHGLILIDSILKALHFIAYEQKKYEFDHEIEIIPVEYSGYQIKYKFDEIGIVPREIVRPIIFKIIKKQELTSLVPLLAAYFLHYLETSDMRELIIEENNGFFNNIIKILGDYQDELYYCNDSFYIGHLKFFEICRSIDKNILTSLMFTVMNDDSITNYYSIIKERLIRKFAHTDLIEILESLNIKHIKAFLISVSKAVNYFEASDGYTFNKAFRYIVKLEKYFTKSLKESIVKVVKESEPESVYLDDKLLRKTWDLPLNMGKIGWLRNLELDQLEELLPVISSKYKDKDIENHVKTEFFYLIKEVKNNINDLRKTT